MEPNSNVHSWKFWLFCFEHCTKCQIFVAKKRKKNVLKNQWILKLLKNDEFSTIVGLTVALWSDSKIAVNPTL